MPLFKTIARYFDLQSGMSWSHTNWRTAADADAAKVAFLDWHDAYMAVCASPIHILDLRVYDDALNYAVAVFQAGDLIPLQGQIAGNPTEISSYVQLRCTLLTVVGMSSAWKLHGISDTLVTGSVIEPTAGEWTAVRGAAANWFQAYRPVAGPHSPIISPPQDFSQQTISGMYARRTGRSFLSIGQQARYSRSG